MARIFRRVGAKPIVVAGLIVGIGGGVAAMAAIPDADGTIHACYSKQSGNLRVNLQDGKAEA